MVDINKIKARLEAANAKVKDRGKLKDKVECFYKHGEVGDLLWRAVEYPHSNDPESEPFCERHYHWNIPGQYAVYCPQKNEGKKCAVCDFVWDNMKANKGNKPGLEEWRERLPQLQVMVAGKPMTSDGTDIETTARFIKFGSDLERMSENHKKLYKFFSDEPTWMSHDKIGFNIEMNYVEPSAEQKKGKFAKAGVMLNKTSGINLARKPSVGFASAAAHKKFVESIPNIDELAPFTKKTEADIVAVLAKWLEIAEKKAGVPAADTKSVGTTVEGTKSEEVTETQVDESEVPDKVETQEAAPTPKQTKLSKLQAKLAEMGVKG